MTRFFTIGAITTFFVLAAMPQLDAQDCDCPNGNNASGPFITGPDETPVVACWEDLYDLINDDSPGNPYYVAAFDLVDGFVPVCITSMPPANNCVGMFLVMVDAADLDGYCAVNGPFAFNVMITDDVDPTITLCPADVTIDCGDDPDPMNNMALGIAEADDNCMSAPDITFDDVTIAGGCPGESTIERTWTAEDLCGNTATCLQVISLTDTEAPTFTAPADLDITVDASCTYDADIMVTGQPVDLMDNCSNSPMLTFSDVSVFGPCGLDVITRTWVASDGCGNTSSSDQIITVIDEIPPVMQGCPASLTVECDVIPGINDYVVSATDNCSALVPVTADEFTEDDPDFPNFCPHYYQIVRTWSVVDDCGNTNACVQVVRVRDTTAPDITCPTDAVVECDGDFSPASLGEATADDNCTIPFPDMGIDYSDNIIPGACAHAYTIERTWTATDECFNSTFCIQTITVEDNTSPVITCPDDAIVECNQDMSPMSLGEATATDNCTDPVVNISPSDGPVIPGLCTGDYSFERTWTATDACGNTEACIQIITVTDTEGPIVATCDPDDMNETVECGSEMDNQAAADAWHAFNLAYLNNCVDDDCGTFSITHDYDFGNLVTECCRTGTLTVTYTATDDCGNMSTIQGILVIEDTTDPDITACDPDDLDQTHECDGPAGNEAAAVLWDAANIAYLEGCATDLCCDPVVTSDFDWNNRTPGCGNTSVITVTYSVTDDCGNVSQITGTFTVVDTQQPDLGACDLPGLSLSMECLGDPGNLNAAVIWNDANIVVLEGCASDGCADLLVTSDFDFGNLSPDCGLAGSLLVTYSVSDGCLTSTATATLTIEDTTDPDLSACLQADIDATIQCVGPVANEVLADAWDVANRLYLAGCALEICGDVNVTSDYDFSNLTDECASTGSLLVTYTVTDECMNATTIQATLVIEDTQAPDFTACDLMQLNETYECDDQMGIETAATLWDADNITYLQGCVVDACGSFIVTSDFNLANFDPACCLTGSLEVTYTLTDECNNQTTVTGTFTVVDTSNPDLTGCDPDDLDDSQECQGPIMNEQMADAWNAANIVTIEACADDICCDNLTVTSDYDFANFSALCGFAGELIVTYTVMDDCGNTSTITGTFTITDTTDPDLSGCVQADLNDTHECSGLVGNEAAAIAWNAANLAYLEGCAGEICGEVTASSNFDFSNLSDECGFTGAITVTYRVSDECGNSSTMTGTFTIEDNTAPDLSACDQNVLDGEAECDGALNNEQAANDWNDANILYLESCAQEACGSVDVTHDFNWANLSDGCGLTGSLIVTYTVTDECNHTSTVSATFSIIDTTDPDLTLCDENQLDDEFECDNMADYMTLATNWNTANEMLLASCASDLCGTIDVTSDFDFANLIITCGAAGSLTVVYTVEDECGNTSQISGTLLITDNTNPDLTACDEDDLDATHECDGPAGNEAAADAWNAANIINLEVCANDICGDVTVTSDYDFANLVADCGSTGTLTVTYTVTDECNNTSTISGTFTIEDNVAPDLSLCDPDDLDDAVECGGPMANEMTADNWNAANIMLLSICGTDDCDAITVTSDYDFTNLVPGCGNTGTLIVTYTVEDACNNTTQITGTFSISDTQAPDLTGCVEDDLDLTHECDGPAGNETAADAWNASNITLLENCANDVCGDFTVTSDYDFVNFVGACGFTGAITVTYSVTDECGNTSTISGTFTVEDTTPPTYTTPPMDVTVECSVNNPTEFSDWLTTYAGAVATDDCGTVTLSSNGLNPVDGCGNTVVYHLNIVAEDECGNENEVAVTFTIEDTTPPDLSVCVEDDLDATHECDGPAGNEAAAAAWNAANITTIENCATDYCAPFIVTSDYDFANLVADCGSTGTLTVTYTVTDECNNTSTISGTFTIEDNVAPDLSTCDPDDLDDAVECGGPMANEVTANNWNAANMALLLTCGDDACDNITVDSDYNFANLVPGCGNTGTLIVTYTVEDACNNTTQITGTFSISDTQAPDLTGCVEDDLDLTHECDGPAGNETAADAWNASNITLLENCANDVCGDFTVTSDYDFVNFVGACGFTGAITVTYSVTDECGNTSTISGTFTVEDTTPPAYSTPPMSVVVECSVDNPTEFSDWLTTYAGAVATDDCGTVTLSSNGLNPVDGCGNTVVYHLNIVAEDECGNENEVPVTFTIEDTTPPDLSVCVEDDLDDTHECDGQAGNEAAAAAWNAANITTIENCATDYCASFVVTSDYDFANLVADCGSTGTLTVTYTVTDECNNSSTISGTFTIEDNVAPDLSGCDPAALNVTHECDGPAGNEAAAALWNADNITYLQGCATDDCDAVMVTSDYDFANLVGLCGNTGTLTVTYTVTDACGNSSQTSGIFTIEDTTFPDLTGCNPADLNDTHECDGPAGNETAADAWNASNITLLENCANDVCGDFTVTSDYDFVNFVGACGFTGAITVTYSVTDECGNTSTISGTFTVEDTTPPAYTTPPMSVVVECSVDNPTEFSDWLTTYAGAVATDDCGTVTLSSNGLNPVDGCGNTVVYHLNIVAEDECGNENEVAVTFTIEDTTPPDLSVCVEDDLDDTHECDGQAGNEAAADAWNAANITTIENCATDYCASFVVTSDYDFANLVAACGSTGTLTVTYTVTDECNNSSTISGTFTIEDNVAPDLSGCDPAALNVTHECDGPAGNEAAAALWNADNITYLQGCATDDCDAVMVTSDYDFANLVGLCGNTGTLTVTYTVTDACGNSSQTSGIFTIEDTMVPDLTGCNPADLNATHECDGPAGNEAAADAWDAANIATLEGCALDACGDIVVTSDYAFINLLADCGNTGSLTVTYTVTDECGLTSTITGTFTIEDNVAPDLTGCNPADLNDGMECDGGLGNEAAADVWNAANILTLEGCATDACGDFVVTSDYDFANFVVTCATAGSITVIYSVTDGCGNTSTITGTFTIEDTTDPDLSGCTPGDLNATHECDGSLGNEAAASAWDVANITTLEGCATDVCGNISVTSDYDFANLVAACGSTGLLTVTYTVTDECSNTSTISGTFTIEDNVSPDLSGCDPAQLDATHECDGPAGNEAAAAAWDADNITYLQGCATDDCDVVMVTSDYDFANLVGLCGNTGTLTVTYTVTDACGNSSLTSGIFTIEDTTVPDLTGCNPVDLNATHECDGPLGNELAAETWDAVNIATLEGCASDACGDIVVTSDYAFMNLVAGCGNTGSLTVTYTVTDECGLTSTITGTFTIEDNVAPDLTGCNPADLNDGMECDGGMGNEAAADVWNAANILTLESCATDACGDFAVTSDYDFANYVPTCATAGSIIVTYSVTDDCGNTSTITGTFTIEDTTDPDLSGCTPGDLNATHECDGPAGNEAAADAWDAANITTLEGCATDECGNISVTSDYNFANLVAACGSTGSLTVTYTVTDECSNTSTITGTFTIEDNVSPDLSGCDPAALNATHECDGPAGNEAAAAAWDAANITYLQGCATDDCDAVTVTSDYDFAGLTDGCGNTGMILVTYTVTDACAHTSTITGTFTIEDTTAPDLTGCNQADLNAPHECDGPAGNEAAADAWNAANIIALESCANDACGDFEVTSDYDFSNLVGLCGFTGTLTVTYTVTDSCGNSSSISGTFTIEDNTHPDLIGCNPDDLHASEECAGVAANEVVLDAWNADNITLLEGCAADLCGGVVVTSDYDFADFSDGCGFTGSIIVTYTVSDECSNSTTITGMFTIEDNTAPDLTGCDPALLDLTHECDGEDGNESAADIWNAANISTLEGCAVEECGNVMVFSDYDFANLVIDCGFSGTLTVMYTVTDECGNTSTITGAFTIVDTEDPAWDQVMPVDVTVECDAIPVAVPNLPASDACDGNALVTYSTSNTQDPDPDACGNQSYLITRTWVAEDACGNAITHTQTITVVDTTDPVWDQVMPADVTVECDAIPDPLNPVTASDNCDENVVVTLMETSTQDADPTVCDHMNYTITRTWTATDNCGNFIVHTQVITVEDTTAPVWDQSMPGDEPVECDAVPAPFEPVAASDNCDADVVVTFLELSTQDADPAVCGHMNYTITRTWTATDNCGNETVHTQVITVEDTTAPTWDQLMPEDETVECDAIPAPFEPVAASDNCDADVVVSFMELSTQDADPTVCGHMNYTITRTWTATDNCGNETVHTQVITVEDTTAPTWDQVMPDDETVECDAVPAPFAPVTASDNCDQDVSIDFDEIRTDGPCEDNYTLTRTWTATDNCGNFIVHTQTITVEDTTNPVWDQVMPDDLTVECDAVPAPFNPVTASDNCDPDVDVSFEEDSTQDPDDGSCGHENYTLTRTWTATDNCGNFIVHTQIITVEDTTDPVWDQVMPDDLTVECDAVPAPFAPVTASDNCDSDVLIEFQESSTQDPDEDSCGHENYTLTRTWTATDNCGNSIVHTQTITVEDTTNPVWDQVMPDDLTVECDAVPEPFAPVNASDNCDSEVLIVFEEVRTDGPCEDTYTLTRTWTATDNCGNSIQHVQVIEVEDTTDPVAECQDITIYLDEFGNVTLDPVLVDNGSSDNCDADLTFSVIPDMFDCGDVGPNAVTLTVEDNCGHTSDCAAIVTVLDTVAPEALCKNAIVFLDANGMASITVGDIDNGSNDACGLASLVLSRTEFFCSDLGDVLVTLTVTDVNGNVAECTAFVTVDDIIPPVAVCKDIMVSLNGQGEVYLLAFMIDAGSTDNCNVGDAYVIPDTLTCDDIGANFVILVVSDIAGNTSTCTSSVVVKDDSSPTASCKNITLTLNANGDPIVIQPADIDNNSFDNCGFASVEISKSVFTCSDWGPNVVKLILTDPSGNKSECSAIVTIVDNLPPVWTFLPGDVTVYCVENGANEVPLAEDNCDLVQVTLKSADQEVWPAGPPNSYLVRRIWMAQDGAGNTVFYEQIVYVLPGGELFVNCNQDIVTPETNIPIKVTWPVPFVDDICSGKEDMYQISGPIPGSYFNPGSKTIITYEYIDTYGTRWQCAFWVTVPNDSSDYALILNEQECHNLVLEDCQLSDLPSPDNYSFEYIIINQVPVRFNLESVAEMETYADGSARVRGQWVDMSGLCGWDMDIWLHRRRTHDGWVNAGGKINNLVPGANPELWDFFEVDGTRSTMTGFGCYAGQEYQVTISPNFSKFGFQYGVGANTKTLAHGGWVIIGIRNPNTEQLLAQGIFSFELDCQFTGFTLKDAAEVVSLDGFDYPVVWSNGVSGPELGDVPAGNYSVTITDQNGKDSVATFVLIQPTDCEGYFENACRPGNVATDGQAKQVSTFQGAVASRAIDGNTDGNAANNSVSGTLAGFQNWWSLDMILPQDVHKIRIWNRTDCCSDWLQPIWVFVSEYEIPEFGIPEEIAQIPWITAFYHDGPIDTFAEFDFQGKAQRIKIQLGEYGRLMMAEVQVLVCQPDQVGIKTDDFAGDGTGEEAEVSRISPDDQIPVVSTWPNPASDMLDLEVRQEKAFPVTISVMNLQGKEMYRTQLPADQLHRVRVDVGNWAPGLYFLTTTSPAGATSQPVTIQR